MIIINIREEDERMMKMASSKQVVSKCIVYISTFMMIVFISMSVAVTSMAAPGFGVSAPGSVDPNGTFTVSFGSGTEGQYTYSVSGGTLISAPDWVSGSGSLTVQAGGSGKVTVTVTAANVTTTDYQDIEPGTSKSVSVSVTTPQVTAPSTSDNGGSSSGTSNNNTPAPQDDRSRDNLLNALSIDGAEISPAFEAGVVDYTAEVWDVAEITIKASARDGKATVSGTGTQALRLGENPFDIIVTAENQTKKTYHLVVTLNEKPTVFMEYGGKKLGVVKNNTKVEALSSFDKCEVEIDGETVDGWYSTPLDMTILYMIDEDDTSGFYVYKEGAILSQIETVTIKEQDYFVFKLGEEEQKREGYVYEEIMLGEIPIMGWSFVAKGLENYKIIQLMNVDGVTNEYLYSVSEDTFILSPGLAPINDQDYETLAKEAETSADLAKTLQKDKDALIAQNEAQTVKVNILVIVVTILSLAIAIFIIYLALRNRKKKTGAVREGVLLDVLEDDEELDYDEELGRDEELESDEELEEDEKSEKIEVSTEADTLVYEIK